MEDIGLVLQTLRDPAGVPAHPILFQWLMILTWVFHIAFVHLALGACGLAIVSFTRSRTGDYWERLSMAMTKVAKISVSLLIVLGVAPLLFTQVIYDPQWYASNVLSARWVIIFIFTLIVAYCLWFVFYFSNHEGAKKWLGLFAVIALGLFILEGLIMHALSYQAILPTQWMQWYAPNGIIDMRGVSLHAIHWPRFLFIISLSLPTVGLFLLAYADYFKHRSDREPAYRDFCRALGRRLAIVGFAISLILLLWWQMDRGLITVTPLNNWLSIVSTFLGWLLFIVILALIWGVTRFSHHGYMMLANGFAVLSLLAIWRESIRATALAPFGYTINDYTINVDWPSLILFFTTFIGIGGLVGGFYLTLLYRSGRVSGEYIADELVSRMGTAAVSVTGIWIAIFFVYGISIWVYNVFSF